MKRSFLLMGLFVFAALFQGVAVAKTREVTVATRSDGSHTYFFKLIERALALEGIEAKLKVEKGLPPLRLEKMTDDGEVAVHEFGETPARSERWLPVHVGLTFRTVSKRVLVIRPEDQPKFSKI